jgi:hypothetical protein
MGVWKGNNLKLITFVVAAALGALFAKASHDMLSLAKNQLR